MKIRIPIYRTGGYVCLRKVRIPVFSPKSPARFRAPALSPRLLGPVKWALSAAILAALLLWMDVEQIAHQLRLANWTLVVPAMGGVWILEGLNAAKVRLIWMAPGLKWLRLVRFNFIKTFFYNLIPGGFGGEAVRMLYIGRETGSNSDALAVVLIDRITGLWLQLALLAALTVYALRESAGALLRASAAVAVVVALALGGVLAYRWIYALLDRSAAGIARVTGLSIALDGRSRGHFSRLLHSRAHIGGALLLGIVYQGSLLLLLCILGRSLGFALNGFQAALLLFATVVLASLPVTVAGWGLMEWAFAVLFPRFGFNPEQGVAVSLLWHAVTLPAAGLGWLMMVREGFPWGQLAPGCAGSEQPSR